MNQQTIRRDMLLMRCSIHAMHKVAFDLSTTPVFIFFHQRVADLSSLLSVSFMNIPPSLDIINDLRARTESAYLGEWSTPNGAFDIWTLVFVNDSFDFNRLIRDLLIHSAFEPKAAKLTPHNINSRKDFALGLPYLSQWLICVHRDLTRPVQLRSVILPLVSLSLPSFFFSCSGLLLTHVHSAIYSPNAV
ncbi:hypothetical protein BC939DRAFT_333001 [Gamsiella multidivaricata]|uniref:uncharacterized protein n=1 Tax=Gamsiella multidivaricata TaxID=101098 RepID=UPI00222119E8|nr:uncharacterized protein BC939DRAFT_333001 [Gamsiella multidivaricata]KAI7817305.1 hypothetical protein BC939DRAFT_333001 [Gamsiella multidivaricata]